MVLSMESEDEMDFFNLPQECVVSKEIPIATIIARLPKKTRQSLPYLESYIESCCLYAVLNKNSMIVEGPQNDDTYYNEVLFLFVQVNAVERSEALIKCLLRIYHYQTVIVLKKSDEYCFAAGFVRDAKRNTENKKIIEHTISPWLRRNDTNEFSAFNINKMDMYSFESIYRSITQAIDSMNEKCIPLSFVTDIYAYTHGLEPDISESIVLQKKIKQMCPNNRFKSTNGVERYLSKSRRIISV